MTPNAPCCRCNATLPRGIIFTGNWLDWFAYADEASGSKNTCTEHIVELDCSHIHRRREEMAAPPSADADRRPAAADGRPPRRRADACTRGCVAEWGARCPRLVRVGSARGRGPGFLLVGDQPSSARNAGAGGDHAFLHLSRDRWGL